MGMRAGTILEHPVTWGVFLVCALCGIYVKRSLGAGLFHGLLAPVFLSAVWAVALFGWIGIWLLVDLLLPGIDHAVAEVVRDWPGLLVLFLHPATLVTFGIYLIYLRSERGFDHSKGLSGYTGRGSSGPPLNVFRRTIRW